MSAVQGVGAVRLVEMETARQDWKRMLCGCGDSAEHLARDLLQLAAGALQEQSHVSLEGHVWSPTVLRDLDLRDLDR